MNELYSVENAHKFNWSSVSGNLIPERISHLETYLVGNRILDAGCGGGAYVEFLSQQGLEAIGIDKYDQFLQFAKEKGRAGTYIQGDLTCLPFPDKTFDCTYCFDVLEHIDDQLAIQELARVTTKRLILAVPQKDELMHQFGLTFITYQDSTHLRYYTEESLKELIRNKINFSHINIFSEGIVDMSSLVTKTLLTGTLRYPSSNLRSIYKIKASNSLINKVLSKVIDLVLEKLLDLDNLDRVVAACLLDNELFRKINLGLVAVVDLE